MKVRPIHFLVLIVLVLSLIVAIFALLTIVTPFNSPTTVLHLYPSALSPLPSGIKHVIIIVEENEPYGDIVNCTCAPYQNALITNFSSASSYFSPEHPSLPNYLDLTGGSDLGETNDCTPPTSCPLSNTTNITDLLVKKGLTWREYAESMPAPCYLGNTGEYVTRHNPFVYYPDIRTNSTYCNENVVPMNVTSGEGLINDLNSGNLANYSFVTPNLCDDGHNSCSPLNNRPLQVDTWLGRVVPAIMRSQYFNSTAVFIVYDEGDISTVQSQVVCILVSPFSKRGYVSPYFYTHYSLLATVEDIFGTGNLGRNDASAVPMNDLFS